MRARSIAVPLVATLSAALPMTTGSAIAAAPGTQHPTLRVVGYGAEQRPHSDGISQSFASKGGRCATLVSDADGSYPGPFLVEPGTEKLRISLHTAARPTHHSIAVYAAPLIDHPNQRAVHPGSKLMSVKSRDGHRTWQVRATLHLGAGQPAYLNLSLGWKNQKCGGSDHFGYAFHVEAAS